MATLNVVEPTIDGNDPQFVTPAGGGDNFAVDDDTVLHIRNDNGSTCNVTITSTVPTSPGVAAANKVIAVATGARRDIRLKPSTPFRDANGRATATCSVTASVLIAVTRVA